MALEKPREAVLIETPMVSFPDRLPWMVPYSQL